MVTQFLEWLSSTKGTIMALLTGPLSIVLNTVNDIRNIIGDFTAIGIGIVSLILIILTTRIKYIQLQREKLALSKTKKELCEELEEE